MSNTQFSYLYRDASNYKQYEEVVLAGDLTTSQITPYLSDGLWFIPSQIGLEDLQARFGQWDDDDDHPWHELVSLDPTDAEPTVDLSACELLEHFRAVQWDDTRARY